MDRGSQRLLAIFNAHYPAIGGHRCRLRFLLTGLNDLSFLLRSAVHFPSRCPQLWLLHTPQSLRHTSPFDVIHTSGFLFFCAFCTKVDRYFLYLLLGFCLHNCLFGLLVLKWEQIDFYFLRCLVVRRLRWRHMYWHDPPIMTRGLNNISAFNVFPNGNGTIFVKS